jgi:formylglycine-generating enzyme required for sulfatase activity
MLETDPLTRFSVPSFRLARYPTTWSQYSVFLDADDGYCKEVWWEGRSREDEPGRRLWSFANYPAINVSWFDALAYCRWLSVKLNLDIRLPTEWEWQWAAVGDTQQDYPWPGDWNSARANIREAGIGRTVAVGLYPLGRCLFGVDDMIGNICEWCLNTHNQPSNVSLDTDEARVVRGGSWYNLPFDSRSSARDFNHPAKRHDSIGFRVLCSSPIDE